MIERRSLEQLIEELAGFGATSSAGVDRPSLSRTDLEARRFLIDLARDHEVDVKRDAIANLFLRVPGRDEELAPVVTGSHIDSQPTGGKLDGAYGICAGLEIVRSLSAGDPPLRSVEVAIWTNEEGSRFTPGAMGSAAFVNPDLLTEFLGVRDINGTTFEEALSDTNYEFRDVPLIESPRPFHAFVELHIEQGPVLERDGVAIGAVVGTQGCRWYKMSALGRAAHAGTTPPSARSDPLRSLHQVMTTIYGWSVDEDLRVTVGSVGASPGSTNTIPESAEATLDLRHPRPDVLDELEIRLSRVASSVSPMVQITREFNLDPARFSDGLVECVERSSDALGLTCRRMLSGAFHDAVHLNSHCPTTMIFVPSHKGISHHPDESTHPEALFAGAQVLESVVTQLAETDQLLDSDSLAQVSKPPGGLRLGRSVGER